MEVEEQWDDWLYWSPTELAALREQEGRYLRGAKHVFVAGRPTARAVEAYGLDKSLISVVGGGANLPPVGCSIAEKAGPVVLFVGHELARKGFDVLLEAFRQVRARIPSSVLRVVGGRPAQAAPGVQVLGPVKDRDEMRRLYREARVLALPSLFEPYGLVLLEAMACGVPCVGTPVGSIPDIIDDGITGRVIKSHDPAALADALLAFLEDPVLAHRAGSEGLRKVRKELNWSRVADHLIAGIFNALD